MTAILLDGIAFGLQLSMLAVGLTLVFGLGGILNLAHGQFAAVAAIVAARAIAAGSGTLVAIIAAILVAGLLAWCIDATLLRPVYRLEGDARVMLSLLVTLGIAFALDGLLITSSPFTLLNLGIARPAVEVLGVTMRTGAIVAAVIALTVLSALAAGLRLTMTGRAIRSVVEDEEGARLCGVDPSRVRTWVFVMAGMLAGLVAVTQGLTGPVGATSGFDLTVLALVVAVVGGLGRVSGAMLAGVLLGIVHAFTSFYVGAFVTFVVLLLAAVLVILVRPHGILGTRP